MDNQLYRDIILEHWKHPQNYGTIYNADVTIYDYNPLCGDSIQINLKINKGNIDDIKFSGEGCAISRASASILTEYTKKKSVQKILNMSQKDFLKLLGIQLTPARLKCALLSYSVLQRGLQTINPKHKILNHK